MKNQKEKRDNENVPDNIDGIVFGTQKLDESFHTEVRRNGGQLTDEEIETLKFPPRYTLYEKPMTTCSEPA